MNRKINNINEEKNQFTVHIGYASQAAVQRWNWDCEPDVCGDTACSCRLPDGSRGVILSDGMGHGCAAAAESRAAAGLLRRLLKQGIPSAKAIKEVNLYLLKKNIGKKDTESFATVDLAVIGQTEGRAKFYKMGAAPSYIVRGRRIRKIQRPALPAGILPEIRLTHVSARLAPGDIIIMMSDGICDSGCRVPCSVMDGSACCGDGEPEDWVETFLASLASEKPYPAYHVLTGPRQLANAILDEAKRRYGSTEADDATVIVIQIR